MKLVPSFKLKTSYLYTGANSWKSHIPFLLRFESQKIVAGLKLYIQCYVIEQEPIRRNVQLSVGEKLG